MLFLLICLRTFPFINCFFAIFIKPGFIYFFGTVKVFGMFFSVILFNFVVKRAMGLSIPSHSQIGRLC